MLIRRKKGWEIPDSQATSEAVFFNRRAFLRKTGQSIAGAGALAVLGCDEQGGADVTKTSAATSAEIAADSAPDTTLSLYPARRNAAYTLDRALTPIGVTSKYNNFYEFGSHKQIASAAQALKIRPWQVVIDGEVDKPLTLDIDELIRKMPLEERLYRHRCVEAWSMAVPWTGFPLAALVALARPTSAARYVRMETFQDSSVASGQKQFWYPWPYTEGLTMAEATNELAFLATGVYGQPLLKQFGAPLRLAVPWKYGFKSIKSIVRFTFTGVRPVSFWEEINAREYGFWANVNPKVPHPRWSQATEEVLGTGERVPTQLYNGYAEQVAGLYRDLAGETLYR